MIDWSICSPVERDPAGKSALGCYAGARVPFAAMFENLDDDASVHLCVEWRPGVMLDQARDVVVHAARGLIEME